MLDYRQENFPPHVLKKIISEQVQVGRMCFWRVMSAKIIRQYNAVSWIGNFTRKNLKEKSINSYVYYFSNRPHFLWVYRRDNPRGMLGEHEKSL